MSFSALSIALFGVHARLLPLSRLSDLSLFFSGPVLLLSRKPGSASGGELVKITVSLYKATAIQVIYGYF
jgi:hypothetical protein